MGRDASACRRHSVESRNRAADVLATGKHNHAAPAAPAPTASTTEVAQRTQAMATANAMQWHQGAEVRSHTPGLRALGPLAPRRKALPWTYVHGPPEVPCAPRVHMRAAAEIESAMLLVHLKSGRAVPPVMHQLRSERAAGFEVHEISGDLVGSPLTWRRTRQGWRACNRLQKH